MTLWLWNWQREGDVFILLLLCPLHVWRGASSFSPVQFLTCQPMEEEPSHELNVIVSLLPPGLPVYLWFRKTFPAFFSVLTDEEER